MPDKVALDLLVKARTRMLFKDFFFGRLALYLRLVEEPGIPTLAVDGEHIFYNPEFVKSLSDELRTSAIIHEIGHCIFDHTGRRNGRDPKGWNCAGDFAINLVIQDAGYKLGKDWLVDEKYRGWSAEKIYDDLKQNGGKGKGEALCDIRQKHVPNSPEQTQATLRWQTQVQQVAIEAKRAGKLNASLERLIGEVTKAKVPWRDVLRKFLMAHSANDYTWLQPNRKFVANGLYLPRMWTEALGHIAVIVDTSGSIGGKEFDAFMGEIQGIVDMTNPERVTVIMADAAVGSVQTFGQGELIAATLKGVGGGGTDFRPALDLLAKDPPVAAVYLTDLYGPCGEPQPYPVLWCCTTNQVAPWGETIEMEV